MLFISRKGIEASICLNVSINKEKNIICTPFSHNSTPFLMCHKVQGTQHFTTLMQVFTGADPLTDPRVGCKSHRVVRKARKNAELVMKSPTGRYTYRQVVMAIPTRRRVGDIFCTASRRSTTSPKPPTDKPDNKQTSRKERQAGSMFPILPDRTDCFCGSVSIVGSRIGIHIILYKPPSPVMCHSFHTLKMTGTHQEQLVDHLRVLLFFVELNLFFYVVVSTHRRQQNPVPAQPASPSPPPPRRRKPQNPWDLPWILQRGERLLQNTRANPY